MEDTIKRSDAIKAIAEYFSDGDDSHWNAIATYIINGIPSAEPKQDEWIPKEMWAEGVGMGEQYGRWYECSECHREYRGDMESCHNFCPNCGAKMEGADDE